MMLTPKPVLYLWDHDFSALVREVYGRPYNLTASYEASQDTLIQVSVPDTPFGVDDDANFAGWRDSDPTSLSETVGPPLEPLCNDLHERGLLPAGDYVIHVWW